jgi:electron transfer flavoprotein alpha subunit
MVQLPQGVERILLSTKNTPPPSWLIGEQKITLTSENGVNNPHLVIVCGAGIGSRESCGKARALADRLHAGFGLTRMAALSGWGNPDEIVGQSGATVSPEVCLVLGASGAGAFLVGIENAGKVIAVNTDRNALIFNNVDIGAVADAPALVAALLERVGSPCK